MVVVLIVPLLAYAGLLSARQALAELYAWSARSMMSDSVSPPRSLDAARLSVHLHDTHVENLHLLAWREGAAGNQEATLEAYRRSVEARPGWPHSWAALARFLASSGDYGENLDEAIVLAQRYGPAERSVHGSLAELGIVHWFRLSPKARLMMEESIAFTLAQSGRKGQRKFLELVIEQRQQRLFCRRFATEVEKRWCAKSGDATGKPFLQ